MVRFLAVHGLHLAGVLCAVGWIILDRFRRARTRHGISPGGYPLTSSMVVTAAALLGAAIVHALVIPEHFEESTLYGGFFTAAATMQTVAAVLVIVRPCRLLLQAVAIGSVATILLWAVTRTVGLPVGPEVGRPEAIGGLDVIATICEVVVVCAVARTLRQAKMATRSPLLHRVAGWALHRP